MAITSASAHSTGVRVPGFLRRIGENSLYCVAGFPLAVVSFVVLITLFSVGIGTAVIFVGLVVLVALMHTARAFATIERQRMRTVLNGPMHPPVYRQGKSGIRRLLAPLADVSSWMDLLHGIVVFPIAIVTFVVTITWWAVGIGGVLYLAWDWALPFGPGNTSLPELLGLGSGTTTRILFYEVVGVIFLLTLPLVVRACAVTQATVGRLFLTRERAANDPLAS